MIYTYNSKNLYVTLIFATMMFNYVIGGATCMTTRQLGAPTYWHVLWHPAFWVHGSNSENVAALECNLLYKISSLADPPSKIAAMPLPRMPILVKSAVGFDFVKENTISFNSTCHTLLDQITLYMKVNQGPKSFFIRSTNQEKIQNISNWKGHLSHSGAPG